MKLATTTTTTALLLLLLQSFVLSTATASAAAAEAQVVAVECTAADEAAAAAAEADSPRLSSELAKALREDLVDLDRDKKLAERIKKGTCNSRAWCHTSVTNMEAYADTIVDKINKHLEGPERDFIRALYHEEPKLKAWERTLAFELHLLIQKKWWEFNQAVHAEVDRQMNILRADSEDRTNRFVKQKEKAVNDAVNAELRRRYQKIRYLTVQLEDRTNRENRLAREKERAVNDAVNAELHRRYQKITSLSADLLEERKAKNEFSAKLHEAYKQVKVLKERPGWQAFWILVCIVIIIIEGVVGYYDRRSHSKERRKFEVETARLKALADPGAAAAHAQMMTRIEQMHPRPAQQQQQETPIDLEEFLFENAPDEFICGISRGVMEDPVLCLGDGFTYERESFEAWVAHCTRNGLQFTSPKTGIPLHQYPEASLVAPNKTLRALILDYKEKKTQEYSLMH